MEPTSYCVSNTYSILVSELSSGSCFYLSSFHLRPLVSFSSLAMSTSAPNINSSKIAIGITCKLTQTNFLLWKAQVVPILKGVQLFGYLNGLIKSLPAKVTTGVGTEVQETDNLVYNSWMVQDQEITGGLMSSMTEEASAQLTR